MPTFGRPSSGLAEEQEIDVAAESDAGIDYDDVAARSEMRAMALRRR